MIAGMKRECVRSARSAVYADVDDNVRSIARKHRNHMSIKKWKEILSLLSTFVSAKALLQQTQNNFLHKTKTFSLFGVIMAAKSGASTSGIVTWLAHTYTENDDGDDFDRTNTRQPSTLNTCANISQWIPWKPANWHSHSDDVSAQRRARE